VSSSSCLYWIDLRFTACISHIWCHTPAVAARTQLRMNSDLKLAATVLCKYICRMSSCFRERTRAILEGAREKGRISMHPAWDVRAGRHVTPPHAQLKP
jgi:hypothetical protein